MLAAYQAEVLRMKGELTAADIVVKMVADQPVAVQIAKAPKALTDGAASVADGDKEMKTKEVTLKSLGFMAAAEKDPAVALRLLRALHVLARGTLASCVV